MNRAQFFLVCYDIVGDRRRVKVANLLKGYGLRVQKSVFECLLEEDQLRLLRQRMQRYIKPEEDQVRFYPMSGRTRRSVEILGLQPEYEVDDTAFIA